MRVVILQVNLRARRPGFRSPYGPTRRADRSRHGSIEKAPGVGAVEMPHGNPLEH